MSHNALRRAETKTQPPLVINLAEGIDFDDRADFEQVLRAIEGHLSGLNLLSPDLLLTGYDARHDDEPRTPTRETTWALPLAQVRDEISKTPGANNPLVYAGLKYPTVDIEPTIAVYDPSRMQPISGHPELAMRYAPLPGYSIESAKLIEFPIVLAHEVA